MEGFFSTFFTAMWIIVPMGVANMAPVLVRGIPFMNTRIDGGRMLAGKPLFGSHKTWRGLIAAVLFGEMAFLLLAWIGKMGSLSTWEGAEIYARASWFTGFFIGLGAILGDLAKSFFKRRVGIPSGKPWIPFDQVDYLLGGLIALSCFAEIEFGHALAVLLIGVVLHITVNHVGYAVGMRETRW